jgi:hypothetical protein
MEAFFDDGGVGDGGRLVMAIAPPASFQLECAALQEEEIILLLFTGAGLIALFFWTWIVVWRLWSGALFDC